MAHRQAELLPLQRTTLAPRLAYPQLPRSVFVQKFVYLWSDLLTLVVAHNFAFYFLEHFLHLPTGAFNPFQYNRLYIPFLAFVLYIFEGYKSPELRRPERELECVCKALALGFLGLIFLNFVLFTSRPFSKYFLACWLVLGSPLVLAARFTLRAANVRLWKAGIGRRRTLLLGSPVELAGYMQLLSIQRHHAYQLLGCISELPQSTPPSIDSLPVLGALDDWEEILEKTGADLLVIASSAFPDGCELLGRILRHCKELGLEIEFYSGQLANSDLNYMRDEFSGCFRFSARPRWSLTLQRSLKRVIDLLIGLIGSLMALVLTPVIGLLIKLQDGGPVFYRSAYVGQDGQIRHYSKFRTMRVGADRTLSQDAQLQAQFRVRQKLTNDPRVTRLGRFLRKFSLDEFPQFFSVLNGELTFVGPRTIRREEADHYGSLLPKLLSVKSGMTGFWQVMGRQTTTYEERVCMDMFYIDRWSLWLDLLIIAKTFWMVLKTEGAC